MLISEIVNIVNGTVERNYKDSKIKKIRINSREVKKDDIFICLKGKYKNGNDYILESIKNKAKAIITDEDVKSNDIVVIKVKDTYDSLFKLSKHILNSNPLNIIAVTGSIGKTTTKDLIYEILSKKYKVLKSEKNYNNHIGIPLTIFNLDKTYDFLVVELGMNHKGEISKLSKLLNPDIGIITNISSSHIGNLGSIKNILKAKLEILDGLNNKRLIVNGKNKYLNKLKYKNIDKIGSDELIPFGIKSDIDKTIFKVRINGNVEEFILNGPYKHLIPNFLIAIKIGILNNIKINDIKDVLANFTSKNNRLEIIRGKNIVINDTYNSSYESLMGIVDIIKDYKNKVFILGDILELGKYSKKIHKKINNELSKINDLEVITVGNYSKYIKGKHFYNYKELINYLKSHKYKNKMILVKGSRGINLDEVIPFLS